MRAYYDKRYFSDPQWWQFWFWFKWETTIKERKRRREFQKKYPDYIKKYGKRAKIRYYEDNIKRG